MNQQNFYVYVYLDPRKQGQFDYQDVSLTNEPFYVGKGYGFRKLRHLSDYVMKTDKNKMKVNKINKILSLNLEPIIVEFKNNLTESEAFELEKHLIATIGRKDLKKGPLCNLTDGGEGDSGYVMSEEQKEKLRQSKLGKKMNETHRKKMSINQKKRWSMMSDDDKQKFGVVCSEAWTDEMRLERANLSRGDKNPNFGNKWNDEQRLKFSEHQKVNSNFIKNNPQKINPNRGEKCGTNLYTYFIYDMGGNLVYKDNSLLNIAEKFDMYAPAIKKFSTASHFYNGYYVCRKDKDDNEDISFDNDTLEQMRDYDVRYKIGKKLKMNKTMTNYYKYIVYKDNRLLIETYYMNEVIEMFGDQLAHALRSDKFNSGANYKEYFMIRNKLTQEFLNEAD